MDEWLSIDDPFTIYVVLFLALMGGAIGFPIPEDLPLLAAGVLGHMGKGKLEIMFVVCYVAIILGDLVVFFIGRTFGPALFQKKWFRKRLPPSKIKKVRFNLEKRSLLMILLARHLFYLRSVTFLTCGAVRMRISRFLIADMCAALVSVPLMMGLGYLLGAKLDLLQRYIQRANLILLLIVVAVAVGYWFHRKHKKGKENLITEDQ